MKAQYQYVHFKIGHMKMKHYANLKTTEKRNLLKLRFGSGKYPVRKNEYIARDIENDKRSLKDSWRTKLDKQKIRDELEELLLHQDEYVLGTFLVQTGEIFGETVDWGKVEEIELTYTYDRVQHYYGLSMYGFDSYKGKVKRDEVGDTNENIYTRYDEDGYFVGEHCLRVIKKIR